jgi:hypothetical protein
MYVQIIISDSIKPAQATVKYIYAAAPVITKEGKAFKN